MPLCSKNPRDWEWQKAGDGLMSPIVQATGPAPAVDENERLRYRDRRALQAGELTAEELALIAKADVPTEHAHLDEEIKDWRP
jgi:hypothetical protein